MYTLGFFEKINFEKIIFLFLRMRTFRDFEIERLNKFAANARKPDDKILEIEAHHHKLVCHIYEFEILFFIVWKKSFALLGYHS